MVKRVPSSPTLVSPCRLDLLGGGVGDVEQRDRDPLLDFVSRLVHRVRAKHEEIGPGSF
jgi:hypothetical protein